MPIPKPAKGEGSGSFMARCMGDDVMKREYPASNQRAAICLKAYRKRKRK